MKNIFLITSTFLALTITAFGQTTQSQSCHITLINSTQSSLTFVSRGQELHIGKGSRLSGTKNCNYLFANKSAFQGVHSSQGYSISINYAPDNSAVTIRLTGKSAPSVKCGVGNCSDSGETRISFGSANSLCVLCPSMP